MDFSQRDNLFAKVTYPKPFEFNQEVAAIFDDMVSRSVPLYKECMQVLSLVVQQFSQNRSSPGVLLDIGCSTGTTLLTAGYSLPAGWTLIGVDPAAPMLAQAKSKLAALEDRHVIRLEQSSAQDFVIPGCDLVIMNYTLQFLPVSDRQSLLTRIYESLRPGGMLFLSEKIRFASSSQQEQATRLYERFKLANGYSEIEISRKKEALENVLVPLTEEEQETMLNNAGFPESLQLLRCINFVTWLATKA